MSVLHRHREFGVLQALGLTPGQTGAIVLVEGLTLTAVSGFIGVSLGLFATWYFIGDGLDFSALIGEEMTFSGVVIDPVIVPLFSTRAGRANPDIHSLYWRRRVDLPGTACGEDRRSRSR